MERKMASSLICITVICFFINGIVADEQPQKKVMNYLAVMDFNCGTALNKENCVALTNVVIDELVKLKKYTVIDRANRDKILSETGYQQTGCVDDSCTIEMGRQLGVGKLVVGAITKIGETYLVYLQLLNVETAAVEDSARERCDKCKLEDLIDTATSATLKLMGEAPVSTTSGGTQPKAYPANNVPVGEMASVPAGEFMMGCNEAADIFCQYGNGDEKPYHKVYLDAFQIDKYEVTVAQYLACVNAGKCSQPDTGEYCNWEVPGRENHPINCVDWDQSKTYCEYAGKRLPTEAQWEKAARGTDGRIYPWGNEKASCVYAVMYENGQPGCGRNLTWPVGSKPSGASPYGAIDMTGNVWEWTADWYAENYYSSSPRNNPTGPGSGQYRVVRGGDWTNPSAYLRLSFRHSQVPNERGRGGIRCVR